MATQTLGPEDRQLWFRALTAGITGILASDAGLTDRPDDVLRHAGKIADLALAWEQDRRPKEGGSFR
jgi:hypothetical protein